jgi:hypothetical protein
MASPADMNEAVPYLDWAALDWAAHRARSACAIHCAEGRCEVTRNGIVLLYTKSERTTVATYNFFVAGWKEEGR